MSATRITGLLLLLLVMGSSGHAAGPPHPTAQVGGAATAFADGPGDLDDDLGDLDGLDDFDGDELDPRSRGGSPPVSGTEEDDLALPPLPGEELVGPATADGPGDFDDEGGPAELWRFVTAAYRVVGARKRALVDDPLSPWEARLLRDELRRRLENLVDDGGPGFEAVLMRRLEGLEAYAAAGGDVGEGFPRLEREVVRRSVTRVGLVDAEFETFETRPRDDEAWVEAYTAPLDEVDRLCPVLRALFARPLDTGRLAALLEEDPVEAGRILAGELRRGGGAQELGPLLALVSSRGAACWGPVLDALGEGGDEEALVRLTGVRGPEDFVAAAAVARGRIRGRRQLLRVLEGIDGEQRRELAALQDRLGLALLRARRARCARDAFDLARRLDPIAVHLVEHLAVARFRCGDFRGACRDFRAVLERQEATPSLIERLVRAMRHGGEEDRLVAFYEERLAAELDGACMLRLVDGLAGEQILAGRWRDCLETLERSRAWALPRSLMASVLVKAGRAWAALGLKERARDCFGRALLVEPESRRARHGLLRLEELGALSP